MTQIAIPDGFELIYFSWNRLAPFADRLGAFTKVGSAQSIGASSTSVPWAVERAAMEEDVERWDGLS